MCSLKVKGKSVTFLSGRYMLWQVNSPFNLAFKGSLTAGGMRGEVAVVGGGYEGHVSPIELQHYPIDTLAGSADELEGVFAAVRMHQETGDLDGDELMLAKSDGRLLALWTSYEGAPNGPYLADSLVSQDGDTTKIVGHWDPDKPWQTFSAAFFLKPRHPALRPDTSGAAAEAEGRPRPLSKVAKLSQFFSSSNTVRCSGDQPVERQGL